MVPCSGISFIDSTALQDCHNLRMRIHRTMAERGQTSTGWFFGFKLHLITNHRGEPMPITRLARSGVGRVANRLFRHRKNQVNLFRSVPSIARRQNAGRITPKFD